MLTPRQKTEQLKPLVKKIKDYIDREGAPPSMRDIAELAGVKSVSHAWKLVNSMVELKMVKKTKDTIRSIKVL